MTAAAVAAARPRPAALGWRPHRLEKTVDRLRYRPWFAGKDFTSDWTSTNFTMWRRMLSPLCGERLRILEIGSWEGRSAVFFLNFFPRATITCIDTFGGSPEEMLLRDRPLLISILLWGIAVIAILYVYGHTG